MSDGKEVLRQAVVRKNSVEPGIHPCNNVTKPYRILLIVKADGVFGRHNSLFLNRKGTAPDVSAPPPYTVHGTRQGSE